MYKHKDIRVPGADTQVKMHGIAKGPTAGPHVAKRLRRDGKVTEAGTHSELLSHNGSFLELIRNYLNEEDLSEEEDEEGNMY